MSVQTSIHCFNLDGSFCDMPFLLFVSYSLTENRDRMLREHCITLELCPHLLIIWSMQTGDVRKQAALRNFCEGGGGVQLGPHVHTGTTRTLHRAHIDTAYHLVKKGSTPHPETPTKKHQLRTLCHGGRQRAPPGGTS
jgi:hypothetical protein